MSPRNEEERERWLAAADRKAFRNRWRVVLTADEIYKQRNDAAKKEAK